MDKYCCSRTQSQSTKVRSFLLFLLFVLSAPAVIARAQKAEDTLPQNVRDSAAQDAEAMKLIQEGFRLYDEGTAESLGTALSILERAYSITLKTGNKTYQGLALLRMGQSALAQGDLAKALAYNRELLRLDEATDNRYGAAFAHVSIGDVYSLLGEREKSLASYQQAEGLFSVKERREKARVLYKIARLQAQLHDKAAAAGSYRQALTVYGNLVEVLTEPNEFVEVGEMHEGLGDSRKALFYFGKALEMFKGLGYYRREEAETLVKIAAVLSAEGAESEALNRYREALVIQGEVGDLLAEADTLGRIMSFYRARGKDSLAVWYGKQSVNLYQTLRTNLRSLAKESHKSFVSTVESHYRLLADTLIRQGRLAEALQVLVLFKDQNFFDVFRAAEDSAGKSPARLILNGRESRLAFVFDESARAAHEAASQLALLNFQIGDVSGSVAQMEQQKQLETRSKEASDSFRRVLDRVEVELSVTATPADLIATTDELIEIQSALRDLKQATGETTIALYTLLTDDDCHVILVTPDSIKSSSRRGKAAVIKQTASQLFDLLRSPEFDPRPKANELYTEIFQPLEVELTTLHVDTLLWSLDASLRYIPMAALFDGKRYLVERYRHVVFTRNNRGRLTAEPSFPWTRAEGMGSTEPQTVQVLGDEVRFPAVPGAETELRGIFGGPGVDGEGVLQGAFLLNRDFNAQTLTTAARQRLQVIHIASHFRFLPGNEEASFLLLGNGGTLSLAEMQTMPDLFAGVELLVLSACETGAQRADAAGREIDGFSEMAQRLGAGSVIATLWRISDASTPDLMIEFYRQRQSAAGTTKAKALQASQLRQLRGSVGTDPNDPGCGSPNPVGTSGTALRKPYPRNAPCTHPYFWAGFVLTGNGR